MVASCCFKCALSKNLTDEQYYNQIVFHFFSVSTAEGEQWTNIRLIVDFSCEKWREHSGPEQFVLIYGRVLLKCGVKFKKQEVTCYNYFHINALSLS